MPSLIEKFFQESTNLQPLQNSANPPVARIANIKEGLASAKEIDLDEFCRQAGFKWTEAVMVPEALKKHLDVEGLAYETKEQYPYENLIICDIDESVGKGVFLAPQAKPIPAKTIIANYTGRLSPAPLNEAGGDFLPYAFGFEAPAKGLFAQTKQKYYMYAAEKDGNISRFVQDAPTEKELSEYDFEKGKIN